MFSRDNLREIVQNYMRKCPVVGRAMACGNRQQTCRQPRLLRCWRCVVTSQPVYVHVYINVNRLEQQNPYLKDSTGYVDFTHCIFATELDFKHWILPTELDLSFLFPNFYLRHQFSLLFIETVVINTGYLRLR